MGCHTRQYLQPSIPLPTASTRMASAAAKQFRGASLGGPPGSLSPLTANKSWAQVSLKKTFSLVFTLFKTPAAKFDLLSYT